MFRCRIQVISYLTIRTYRSNRSCTIGEIKAIGYLNRISRTTIRLIANGLSRIRLINRLRYIIGVRHACASTSRTIRNGNSLLFTRNGERLIIALCRNIRAITDYV